MEEAVNVQSSCLFRLGAIAFIAAIIAAWTLMFADQLNAMIEDGPSRFYATKNRAEHPMRIGHESPQPVVQPVATSAGPFPFSRSGALHVPR